MRLIIPRTLESQTSRRGKINNLCEFSERVILTALVITDNECQIWAPLRTSIQLVKTVGFNAIWKQGHPNPKMKRDIHEIPLVSG